MELCLNDLSPFFHLPINEASKELGICATVLKKICRKIGISRWPHRKFKSLETLIEKTREEDGEEAEEKLEYLEKTREMLFRQPNLDFKSVVPKHIKAARKSDISKGRDAFSLSSSPRSSRSPSVCSQDSVMVHFQSFAQASQIDDLENDSFVHFSPSSLSSSGSGSESPLYTPFQQTSSFESRSFSPINFSRPPFYKLAPILSTVDEEELEESAILALADMARRPSLNPEPFLLPPMRFSPSLDSPSFF